ncbi:MarR family winged helix-turn-helix transcriptional regulator [Sphaerisporangium fuscum]|uniref:MarR family winged helix-turn-helix transcriptional regulator n=1 Tax=Sphaerisporangium fuscum TaxID=2835868 RepID=UPI001BDD1BD4|nr:MarR family winged helix-turn-helix transcriptional regulator [Sphaerisporangium fuscum]
MTHGEDVAAIEQAMVAIRRSQARRALARLSRERGGREELPDAVFELLDAVDTATARGSAPTVTEAAAALGVDQPRASRLTAQALEAGLLRRAADQADGRRSLLLLTPEGRAALDGIHAFRQRVIAEATAAWPQEDRAALARLLTRFVGDFAAVTDPRG